jgi:hypothetical protein
MLIVTVQGFSSLLESLEAYFSKRQILTPMGSRIEKFSIENLPEFLLIQISRETYKNGLLIKDCHRFDFPIFLDMTLWSSLCSRTP